METFKEILDYIVNNESKKTVGMVCKRIELVTSEQLKDKKIVNLTEKEINALKSQIKEVIYEQYRNMRDFLKTGKIVFSFKDKSKED